MESQDQRSSSSSPVETPISPLLPAFPLPQTSRAVLQLRPEVRRDHAEELAVPMVSPIMSRSPSISSDRFSTASVMSTAVPGSLLHVNPAPAYIAPFGAAQVLGESRRGKNGSDEDDVRGAGVEMQFSPSSLALVNAFLDQLLYSFLSNAKSTSLTALRPAVADVLKSKLATEAIASAEEELHELLAGGEDEEEAENTRQTNAENNRKWDLELVWKRTRLRVMVYARLGEVEDDDEERYVRAEELFQGSERRFSQSTGLVSWAAAIFLTTVLEYVAEQVVLVAAQAARTRVKRTSRSTIKPTASGSGLVTPTDVVTVEDHDMEKVALNSLLGRLWRTWRKSLRSQASSSPLTPTKQTFARNINRDSNATAVSHGETSFGTANDIVESRRHSLGTNAMDSPEENMDTLVNDEVPEAQYPEHVLASNIPLPIGDLKRDVDEIEVPGLARDPDEESDGFRTPEEFPIKRRSSLTNLVARSPKKPMLFRQRSKSVPTLRETIAARELEDERRAKIAAAVATRDDHDDPANIKLPESVEGDVSDDASPEQKCNAEEMAPHKREISPDNSTIGKAGSLETSNGKTVAEAVDEPEQEHESKKEHVGLIAGAVAGASAVAAAAISMVYGASEDKQEETVKQAHEVEDAEAEPTTIDEDVEERDRQKHLLQMKSLDAPASDKPVEDLKTEHDIKAVHGTHLANDNTIDKPIVSGPETVDAGVPSVTTPRQFAVDETTGLVSPGRTASVASEESFSLMPKVKDQTQNRSSTQPRNLTTDAVDPEEGPDEDSRYIGVARTSDTAVSTPRTEEPFGDDQLLTRHTATQNPRRFSRLILGMDDSPPSQKGSPGIREDEEELMARSDGFPRRSVSPVSEQAERAKVLDFRQRALNRLSAPASGYQHSPPVEKSNWRQSFSAASEQNSSWASGQKRNGSIPEPLPDLPVQDHPVIQRIASLKNNNKVKDEDKGSTLTSASIRGPEDFDMFVQGADTVKYTLTPENVRDEASPAEAHPYARSSREHQRTSSMSKQNFSHPGDMRTGRSQTAKQATSAMLPAAGDREESQRPLSTSTSTTSKADKRRSISRPPVRNTSVHRKSGLIAREPQVMTESTRDFADFIRSTGPDKEQPIYPLVSNRSTTSLHSQRSRPLSRSNSYSRASSPGAQSTRSITRSAMQSENVPPVPSLPNQKSSMTPRDPKSSQDRSSALIDFIRSGPSRSSEPDRQRRISRSVAPFRTTLDSDQMNEWGDRTAPQPDLKLNTQQGGTKRPESLSSFSRNSATSRSDLNGTSNASQVVHPAHSGQPQSLSLMPSIQTAPGDPIRKRFRNKDPYAIDLDDDDDEEDYDLLTALPKNRRDQESMVDFLRNTGPQDKDHSRGANGSAANDDSNTKGIARRGSAPSQVRAHGSDIVSMKGRGNTSTRGNSAVSALPKGIAPKTYAPSKMEARSPSSRNERNVAGTSELSDFLRSSGPPGDPMSAPAPGVSRMKSSSLPPVSSSSMNSKMSKAPTGGSEKRRWWATIFSSSARREAASAKKNKAYLDM